ncbi:acyl-CoA thioesterase [Owenweeksia hongkongensis]|uniref:acyl-CoA thioesterase n=1 Tax=Owenweeksia hongkongensis TaxID=253245 RepID=UPI003A93F4DC
MTAKHSISFTVKNSEIDDMGHVNNVVYLKWVQDVAISHWSSVAEPDDLENYRWVVRRHELDYLKAAMPNDIITATTWIESLEGVSSVRMVEIKRGDTILAKAKTTWIMLDAKTGRPARVTQKMQDSFLI